MLKDRLDWGNTCSTGDCGYLENKSFCYEPERWLGKYDLQEIHEKAALQRKRNWHTENHREIRCAHLTAADRHKIH